VRKQLDLGGKARGLLASKGARCGVEGRRYGVSVPCCGGGRGARAQKNGGAAAARMRVRRSKRGGQSCGASGRARTFAVSIALDSVATTSSWQATSPTFFGRLRRRKQSATTRSGASEPQMRTRRDSAQRSEAGTHYFSTHGCAIASAGGAQAQAARKRCSLRRRRRARRWKRRRALRGRLTVQDSAEGSGSACASVR